MAAALAARGIDTVFGLPGGEILAFVDACRRAGLRFVLTAHEGSAAWMAQVMGQLTATPGVCAATLGPGAANLMTAVANAWLDRAPMLAVTAQIPAGAISTMTHQRLPLDRMFAPLTKSSFSVGALDTTALVNHCLDLANAPRPGPVHLLLASDTAVETCRAGAEPPGPTPAAATAGTIQSIIDGVNRSTRPLVLIGLGAAPQAAPAIRRLIDKLQCPFVVTPKVKGIAPEDHPQFAGVASGMAMDREVVATLQEADLIVAIGFDPVECDKTWFASLNVAAIDTVSMAEGEYRPVEAIGEIASLADLLTAGTCGSKAWPADLLDARRQALRPILHQAAGAQGVSPIRLIEELRQIFPRDGIAVCDVGSHKLAMGQFWSSYEPGTFLMSNGLSGMGFGIPAAIAAQLALPKKAVMAVVGDGGMLMMIHDLGLIREAGLPILIVVCRDASLSLIRLSAERRGYPPCGVDFSPPDFPAIAEAFGITAGRADSLAEARAQVERALERRVAYLLEVPVDWREYAEVIR